MKTRIILLIFTLIGFVYSAVTPVVGGWTGYDVKDEGVKSATQFAIKNFNENINKSNVGYKLIRIKKAEGQVVAGMNYRVQFITGSTTCKKDQISINDNSCPFDKKKNIKLQFCKAIIYVIPWEDYMEVTSLSCKKIKK
ncbi:hypothetical protein BJ944DRAFT_271768 [Cunninghamella echinulata]|nr:hypothetical protein BJ944DRAFT_271768 [Cunninghamella echinulata]